MARENDVPKTSAAPGAEPGPSIGKKGAAKASVASPSNLNMGNRTSAYPKSKETPRPTKTEEDIVLSPHLASQTAVIDIKDDEEGEVCQNVQGTRSQQVKHLSARLARDLRPMLHEYVRDKLKSNAHFGFFVLRDVEVKTMESMTNEASALIEGTLGQIANPTKNATSQGIERETEVPGEAATEGD
ncbi:hypothetical protein CGRA01v4_13884 [Colletotrichum graminicola]|uniref:Uncharacterized protein n=1 Tax=Colletotrichum graminicola (strain M1.001 / M2 / FGSC 10212) TaxID=645133 RepID=E3QUH7_COLGM|nr:uncharacterized protein GLRG_09659 [Colletotrichum graminicola M1.001]EFQ34515.1 hypothetical protein GLRG_09659 [Colletotrichum graminicola M1.001]WDK22594.1 hypothetical protein CGRA01v4_13884 [Colletotrichum graminicola]